MTKESYPLTLKGELSVPPARGWWLIKWLLALPHFIILVFLWVAFVVVAIIAFFAILYTRKYPRGLFDFNAGVLKWTWRVGFYSCGALGTDKYPPFTLGDADYPAELQVEYQRHQAENNSDYDSSHVVTLEQLKLVTKQAKQRGEKIVFTNGCFDILHAGHVSYLEKAKALGDKLVVGINDDASVAKLKGASRPINSLKNRMSVLTGLKAVDWVVPFSELTPGRLIRNLNPNILVKSDKNYRNIEENLDKVSNSLKE